MIGIEEKKKKTKKNKWHAWAGRKWSEGWEEYGFERPPPSITYSPPLLVLTLNAVSTFSKRHGSMDWSVTAAF